MAVAVPRSRPTSAPTCSGGAQYVSVGSASFQIRYTSKDGESRPFLVSDPPRPSEVIPPQHPVEAERILNG
ncbi:hypothetical protein Cob_v006366 [Colletotrichum orbiculare MAFF 240422]|uniref:Uncharacterized protein n=1 Tax=Colletotrichum orbiculare (strain 104-T / ATCC 96160 / CBS 514.97 / LARS 414 / MAFF 240422) TaxID=1213857 RepID=A0A484FU81_COLOR|nr:hypothetical protein Cob_v006366 [Colletotrichum orbiculare MAFF 240422]